MLRLAGITGRHHGYAGAGPLTVQGSGDGFVHLGWPDTQQGMYLTPRQARMLANDILKVAEYERATIGSGGMEPS